MASGRGRAASRYDVKKMMNVRLERFRLQLVRSPLSCSSSKIEKIMLEIGRRLEQSCLVCGDVII